MNRLYRWLCQKAWRAGFDAGIQHERDTMLKFTMTQRNRWYFVDEAGVACPVAVLPSTNRVTNGIMA